MDARITRKRLGDLLAYDWIKILLCIAAATVFWILIFTVSAVRLTAGQSFNIYLYGDTFDTEDPFYDYLASLEGELSYDVLKIGSETLDKTYGGQILEARNSVHEGDMLIVDDVDTGTEESPANDSRFRTVADRTDFELLGYDDLLASAEEYLARFYEGDTLNEAAVEENFLRRMKKDNRFRKAAARAEGLEEEKARLAALRDDVEWLRSVLEEDDKRSEEDKIFAVYRRFDQSRAKYPETEYPETEEKRYGFRLDCLKNGNELFRNMGGNCKDIYVCLFDYRKYQPDLQYETIAALRALADRCGGIVGAENL